MGHTTSCISATNKMDMDMDETYLRDELSRIDNMNYDEWKSEINALKEEIEEENMSLDDYSLFITYLTLDKAISGYSDISVIARLTRIFVGIDKYKGKVLFNDQYGNNFEGVRISIAVHPITSKIFIADDYTVYLLQDSKMETIHSIIDKDNGKNKETIIDLAFTESGKYLVLMVTSNPAEHKLCRVKWVYLLDYNEGKILQKAVYAPKNYLTHYKFNHVYFPPLVSQCILKGRNMVPRDDLETVYNHQCLYALDPYKSEIWFIENERQNFQINRLKQEYHGIKENDPILCRISYDTMESLKCGTRSTYDGDIEFEWVNLREVFDENDMFHDMNVAYRRWIKQEVIAFDVDKLYGGVYIIMRDGTFYRIKKKKKDAKWHVTHESSLKDILPLGKPLGICAVSYDSVTGRVIIADNYKIQAVYI